MLKACCTCKQEKCIEEYCKNKRSKDGFSAQCKDCSKKYREQHKDVKYPSKSKEYSKNYRRLNKDKINELRRIRYLKNINAFRKKARERYINNKDIIDFYNSRSYFKHKEQRSIYNKKYRINNKQYIYLRNRFRKLKISGKINIPQVDINKLILLFENKCYYCGIYIESGINLHMDHKIPLSRGGEHSVKNLVPSCSTCNLRKGTKTSEEFIKLKGKYVY